MKNINQVFILPLLAALTVGCASPTAFQSTEYDDVYYSSKDKTIVQSRQVTAQAETRNTTEEKTTGDVAPNPEYSEKNSGTGNSYSTLDNNNADYYSDDYAYTSRLGRYSTPYRSGLSYYDYAYNDFYWYNRNPFLYGRSAFYDPFYSIHDPFFYSPYVGFGYPRIYTGLTVVIGQPFYGGFYGAPFYGGGFYRGFNQFNRFNTVNYYTNSGWYRNDTNNATRVQYGPRRERSSEPTGSNTANTGSRPRNNSGGVTPGSGGGGVVAPGVGGGGVASPNGAGRSTRGRSANSDDIATPRDNVNGVAAPSDNADRNVNSDVARPNDYPTRSTRGRQNSNADTEIPQINGAPDVRNAETPSRRSRRVETGDYNFPDQPARVEESQPATRPGRSQRGTEEYTPAPSRQQQRQEQYTPRTQEQPVRQERARETYQPAPRQERTYEAPRQQERTYEAPSRPAPSNSGGSNDGGGRSGGRPRN